MWRRAEETGAEVAVMMFHSSEFMPGGSPYRPTPASVRDLHACLDRFFGYVPESGGQFTRLTWRSHARLPGGLISRCARCEGDAGVRVLIANYRL